MNLNIEKLYIIQDIRTGKFSNGGGYPKWHGVPKIWTRRALHAHLTLIEDIEQRKYKTRMNSYNGERHPYKNAVIIEGDFITTNNQNYQDYLKSVGRKTAQEILQNK